MNEALEYCYARLIETVKQTLDESGPVQHAVNEINAAGYDVTLEVWAATAAAEEMSATWPNGQLDLFDDDDLCGLLNFDSLLQFPDTDQQFLRSIGIATATDTQSI